MSNTNKKTSDEAAASTLTGAESVRGVQTGGNVRMPTQSIANLYALTLAAVGLTARVIGATTGPTFTVNSLSGWQGIQCNSTLQVTGPNSLTNANQNVGLTQLLFHGYAAEVVSINSSASADKKVWSNYADATGNYNCRIENDALTATYTYMQVARSGNGGTFGSHQPIVNFPIGYGGVTMASTIAGAYQMAVTAGTVAAFSNGLSVKAGTGTLDNAFNVANGANTAAFMTIRGDGKTTLGPCQTANTTALTVVGTASSVAPTATFGGTASAFLTVTDGGSMTAVLQTSTGLGAVVMGASSNHAVTINTNNTARISIAAGGAVTVAGTFACNGVVPGAQPTGYGTPTGAARQASFNAATISLPNLAAHVAAMTIDWKGTGAVAA